MSTEDKLKKVLDDFDRVFNEKQHDIEKQKKVELEFELKRQEIIEHESNKNIGEIVRRLKLKIAQDNLFMDDITREELK